MLTFLHLSDIHFKDRDHGTQFDRDQQVRRTLLEDLEKKPTGAACDAVLITGDIAFGGQPDEYKRAKEFLEEVYARTGASPINTLVVPGNHDIDRRFVEPDLPLWAAHAQLRAAADSAIWHDQIYKQLVRDPHRSILAPLTAYNDFAQAYGCFTGMVPGTNSADAKPQLAWQRILAKPLAAGVYVRINGLNSVLVSDAGDGPGKLILSDFQTCHLKHSPGIVDIVMCHHPPDWLMDKHDVLNALRTFVPVAMFGHEHTARVTADSRELRLYAGAVQPSRRDPHWRPTYHIVQLELESEGAGVRLKASVHTREFRADPVYRFVPLLTEQEEVVGVHRLDLPHFKISGVAPSEVLSNDIDHQCSAMIPTPNESSSPPTPRALAQQELRLHFFELMTPLRYKAAFTADLIRDGDDLLDPQVMWAEVFRRAIEEKKLEGFWEAVSQLSPSMTGLANPFKS